MTGLTKNLIQTLAFATIIAGQMKALSQDTNAIHYNSGTKVFRLDGGA